jgi:hypothetical protein
MKKDFMFGVDAGNIAVADLGHYEAHGGKAGKTAATQCQVIDLEPGKYRVSLSFCGWDGEENASGVVDVQSGKLAIGDACYFFSSGEVDHKVWLKFLGLTEGTLDAPNDKFFSVDTGGDDSFHAEVTIERVA